MVTLPLLFLCPSHSFTQVYQTVTSVPGTSVSVDCSLPDYGPNMSKAIIKVCGFSPLQSFTLRLIMRAAALALELLHIWFRVAFALVYGTTAAATMTLTVLTLPLPHIHAHADHRGCGRPHLHLAGHDLGVVWHVAWHEVVGAPQGHIQTGACGASAWCLSTTAAAAGCVLALGDRIPSPFPAQHHLSLFSLAPPLLRRLRHSWARSGPGC